ncbi:hypothetical protein COS18_00730, partial [Candidatus Falkowbacteria bacterium CG02_land_8_20_14_3_00_36_14]
LSVCEVFARFLIIFQNKKRAKIWERSFGKDRTAYTLLSDVLLLFWRFAKIRGAVKQIFLGSGDGF